MTLAARTTPQARTSIISGVAKNNPTHPSTTSQGRLRYLSYENLP